MNAIPFLRTSTAQELRVISWPKPKPKADEVLVKVHAFGLNFADIVARKGEYKDAPEFPFVPGYESAGVIEEIGDEVDGFSIGDRVLCFTDFGSYAEYVRAKALGCVKLPDSMSFTDGAAIPVQFGTAYHCLFETGSLRPGTRVLIHACAGGVGQCAVQLCLHKQCEIIGTCGSEKKVEILKEMGVHHAINYTTHNYEEEVRRIYPDGVDVILNSLGGDSVKKDLNITRTGGRVVCFGGAQLQTSGGVFSKLSLVPKVLSMLTVNTISLLMQSKTICGVNMKRVGDDRPDLLAYELKEVLQMFDEGILHSHVTRTLNWHKTNEAHSMMENRSTTGKIVLLVEPLEIEESAEQVEPVVENKEKAQRSSEKEEEDEKHTEKPETNPEVEVADQDEE